MRLRHASSLSSIRWSSGSSNDPFFANVVLLVSFDGADGQQVFVDESSTPHSLVTNGNFQSDVGVIKPLFAQSGLADGSGDTITIDGTANLNLDSDDFTLEIHANRSGSAINRGIIGRQGFGNGSHFGLRLNSSGIPTFTGGSTPAAVSATTALALSTWYHLAAFRISGTTYIAVNGVVEGSTATAWTATGTTQDGLIGGLDGFSPWLGNLEEARLTVGISRYPATGFTPPALPFPRS